MFDYCTVFFSIKTNFFSLFERDLFAIAFMTYEFLESIVCRFFRFLFMFYSFLFSSLSVTSFAFCHDAVDDV